MINNADVWYHREFMLWMVTLIAPKVEIWSKFSLLPPRYPDIDKLISLAMVKNFIFLDKKGSHMTWAGTYQFCAIQLYLSIVKSRRKFDRFRMIFEFVLTGWHRITEFVWLMCELLCPMNYEIRWETSMEKGILRIDSYL